jgi:adenosylmethionine-8-amino-7-oxononanoate aminotransferase
VATGFGRTGRMFACEHEAVAPDLLCLAKGITGGYLPLAATLTSERIYEGFLGEFEQFRAFFHGHTYTGNPLACAAALASLDVFAEERTLERLAPKVELLGRLLEPLASHPAVREVRRRGVMTGIELTEHPVAARMGHRVTLEARRRGAIVRPLGDVVVLMPPLSIAEAELRRLVEITAEAIDAATGAGALAEAA